ncbi:MAG: hypothetical protein P4L61_00270 [Candidatus Pacebacteria bacterium]|nr:hypothetical protein [Candidatus Paceibacterota bacterium]
MPPDSDSIENLKKSLYSRSTPDIRTRRRFHASPEETNLPKDWERPPEKAEDPMLNKKYHDHSMSFFTKILIGSALFFLICLGVGAYLFFNGSNLISANNLDIAINGPISIAGGTPFSFGVQVTNKNNVKLNTVDLEVDFPTGSVNPTNTQSEQKNYQTLMDDVSPGGVTQRTVNADLYGQENSSKEMVVRVFYQVPGSNATYEKDKAYDVLISSSPLTISVSSFNQITAGQKFDMKVTLTSNSQSTIQGVLLNVVYPFGYSFASSDQAPLADKATWNIGDISPGQSKTITITGTLQGEDQDSRVFNFIAGAAESGSPSIIGTEYTDTSETVTLQKPFMTAELSFGQDDTAGTGDYVSQFGKPITGTITWFNNLPDAVTDAEIHIQFSGNAFYNGSVSADGGFYDSASAQITLDKTNTPSLGSIPAGGSGSSVFNFTPQDLGTPSTPLSNPSVDLSVSIDGQRTSESNVPQSLSESISRTVKVASNVALSGEALYTTGPFTNTGSFPPKSQATTTYTIVWTIGNSSSAVSGAKVSATLPEDVTWLGPVSPQSEDVQYDASSRTVTWNAGTLAAYLGQNGGQPRQVSFQIALHPSVTDVNHALTLVNPATLSATDNFTGVTVYSSWGALTTRLSTDPGFQQGDDLVTQ